MKLEQMVNGKDTAIIEGLLIINSGLNGNRNKSKNFVAKIDVEKHPKFAENALLMWQGAVQQEEVEDFIDDLIKGEMPRFNYHLAPVGQAGKNTVKGEADVHITDERVLNLTQHPATPEQVQAGVVDLEGEDLQNLKNLLIFEDIPSKDEIKRRAKSLCDLAIVDGAKKIMIGGAPFLMEALSQELRNWEMSPVFAFSKRESFEKMDDNGNVVKTNKFRHLGFVEC